MGRVPVLAALLIGVALSACATRGGGRPMVVAAEAPRGAVVTTTPTPSGVTVEDRPRSPTSSSDPVHAGVAPPRPAAPPPADVTTRPDPEPRRTVPQERPVTELRVTTTDEVERLTGPGSVNRTDERWNVHGTDLGHPIVHHGQLYLVFGDTWGADGAEGDQWRSNVMARVDDPDPRAGLHFASMVENGRGWAGELLPSAKVDGVEKTVIPTNGVSTGERMVLHYMSVQHWDGPGRWTLGHSGLAVSDDDGRTWQPVPAATWPGDSNFGQVAFLEHDGWIHVWGIPGGRFGGAVLARVRPEELLNLPAWRYWDGDGWTGDPGDAVTVVPAPVGELSVRWSAHHRRFVMLYLDEAQQAIVLRTATTITGPWSEPQVVTDARRFPQLYAPYLVPGTDTGDDLYFTMSRFGPYQVFLMRTRLERVPVSPGPPRG